MDLGLKGRAAFVAASSKGMGRAIAERFALKRCRGNKLAGGRRTLRF